MAQQYQTIGRTASATRCNKPKHKLVAVANGFRLPGVWDARLGITLNGTDVSVLASQGGPRPWLGLSLDVSQGTAGQQPLATGAPQYNSEPSVAFTAATSDELVRVPQQLFNTGPYTIFGVIRNYGTSAFCGLTSFDDNGSVGVQYGTLGTGNRNVNHGGVASHSDAAMSTTAPEVFVITRFPGTVPTLRINNVMVAIGGGGAPGLAQAGGTAAIRLGTYGGGTHADMDFLFEAAAPFAISANIAFRLSKMGGARFGVAT